MTTVEYPILFSGPLVRAIIAGRKTQTRRLAVRGVKKPRPSPWRKRKAGDVLWVRETWSVLWCEPNGYGPTIEPGRDGLRYGERLVYRADSEAKYPGGWTDEEQPSDHVDPPLPRWRPSIHMPRWASRITLRLTADARVEPLHAMNNADAVAEGVTACGEPPLLTFANLWDSINNRYGTRWRDNPDVVVVTFERV